jgi:isopentenyl phosphate kinase
MVRPARPPAELTLLKLGGSLITDKTAVEAARPAVLARLAAEIAAAGPPAGLLVAHGSGSFGHVAARRHGIAGGLRSPRGGAGSSGGGEAAGAGGGGDRGNSTGTGENSQAAAAGDGRDDGLDTGAAQLAGVSLTQQRAAALHWQVMAVLAAAGLRPFSIAPSSTLVAAGGRPAAIAVEPLLLALGCGLLPVLYGDVVMDREQGVAICSTERLFELLAGELPAHGLRVRRAVWLGETDGVYDAAGRTVPRLEAGDRAAAERLRAAIGAAAGTDVTGGMLHRVETALALAARGIPSLIANGATAGLAAAALRGEPVAGTEILPAGAG